MVDCAFQASCFGHAFSKACQYNTNGVKGCWGFREGVKLIHRSVLCGRRCVGKVVKSGSRHADLRIQPDTPAKSRCFLKDHGFFALLECDFCLVPCTILEKSLLHIILPCIQISDIHLTLQNI